MQVLPLGAPASRHLEHIREAKMARAQLDRYFVGETLMAPRIKPGAATITFSPGQVVGAPGRAPETDMVRLRFDDQFATEIDVRRAFRPGRAFDAWRAAQQEISEKGKTADRVARLDAAWRELCATNPYCMRKR
jgi:hypothetical protein